MQRFAVPRRLKVTFASLFYELLRLGHNELVVAPGNRTRRNFNGLSAIRSLSNRIQKFFRSAEKLLQNGTFALFWWLVERGSKKIIRARVGTRQHPYLWRRFFCRRTQRVGLHDATRTSVRRRTGEACVRRSQRALRSKQTHWVDRFAETLECLSA